MRSLTFPAQYILVNRLLRRRPHSCKAHAPRSATPRSSGFHRPIITLAFYHPERRHASPNSPKRPEALAFGRPEGTRSPRSVHHGPKSPFFRLESRSPTCFATKFGARPAPVNGTLWFANDRFASSTPSRAISMRDPTVRAGHGLGPVASQRAQAPRRVPQLCQQCLLIAGNYSRHSSGKLEKTGPEGV